MKNDQITKTDDQIILQQNGKTFYGVRNPNKLSKVPVIYSDENGRQICSAHRANGQSICTSTFLMSNGRCKKHGGMTPSGVASPHFKTGRHSRNLPTRLLERYEEALADPEMHSLEAEIALVDARIDDLLRQTDEGGGGDIFLEIEDAYKAFNYASQDGDKKAMRENLRRLDDAIRRGRSESYVWEEIRSLQEQRRKLVLAEAKRLQMTGQTVTVKNVNLLISALLDAVRQEVKDTRVLARISDEFFRIAQGSSVQRQIEANSRG